MAFILDGSTGIATVDGSVSAPSQRGQDTNSGISYAADTIKFSTNGVERMAITNSGVTGITQGIILQVLEKRLDAGFSTESTAYVDVTNLSQAITMTNASNRVLIEAPLWVSQNYTDSYVYIAIYKGSTLLQTSANMPGEENMFANQGKWTFMSFIDTPGAGTHTYKIMCKSENSNKTAKISIGGNQSSHGPEKPDMVLRLTEIAV